MQPTPTNVLPRRKRKRPVSAKAEAGGYWSSDTDEDRAPARRETESRRKKLPEPEAPEAKAESDPVNATRTEEPTTAAALDRPFRGKCLYQSRKCENERALKRNGKAHNLCDEHRSKQNQHQRKFDAKKYSRRKTDGSSGDEEDHHENENEHEHGSEHETRADGKPTARAASRSKSSAGTVAKKEDDQMPANVKAPRRLETKSLSEGVATTMIRQYSHAPESMAPPPRFHEAAHLDPRRPPPLQVVQTPPGGFYAGFAQRPPPNHSEAYSSSELSAARMLVPPHGQLRPTTYVSPRGTPFGFLPRPSIRSQSFDSGITRISPVGGAALGAGGLRPVDRQHQFLHDQRQFQPLAPPQVASPGVTSPKLPSLQQLPLAQPTYAPSRGLPLSGHAPHHHSPVDGHSHHGHSPVDGRSQYRHSPPFYASQWESRHAALQPPPPPPQARGSLLPPLAPLLQPPHQHHSPPGHPGYRSLEPHM